MRRLDRNSQGRATNDHECASVRTTCATRLRGWAGDFFSGGLASPAVGCRRPEGGAALTDDQAARWAEYDGILLLNNVTTLSDGAARALSRHKYDLFLNSLGALSDDAARALSEHKGWVSLGALTDVSDEAAAVLQANPKIVLPPLLGKQ